MKEHAPEDEVSSESSPAEDDASPPPSKGKRKTKGEVGRVTLRAFSFTPSVTIRSPASPDPANHDEMEIAAACSPPYEEPTVGAGEMDLHGVEQLHIGNVPDRVQLSSGFSTFGLRVQPHQTPELTTAAPAARPSLQPSTDASSSIPPPRSRLSFEVSAQINRTLEDLAASMDTTKSEVFRRAIALLKFAKEAEAQGYVVGVHEKDSKKLVSTIVGL